MCIGCVDFVRGIINRNPKLRSNLDKAKYIKQELETLEKYLEETPMDDVLWSHVKVEVEELKEQQYKLNQSI